MSAWLIGLVAVIYLGVAVSELRAGDKSMALVWAAYALANVGLMLKTLSTGTAVG